MMVNCAIDQHLRTGPAREFQSTHYIRTLLALPAFEVGTHFYSQLHGIEAAQNVTHTHKLPVETHKTIRRTRLHKNEKKTISELNKATAPI